MDPPEKKVFDGVYITDFRQKPTSAAPPSAAVLSQPDNVSAALQADIQEIQTSTSHLKRSIVELQKAFEQDPDPVYSEAIQENLVAIQNNEIRIIELTEHAKLASK